MTYEEAIKVIKSTSVMVLDGSADKFERAICTAIKALKNQTPTKPNWVYDDEPLCPYCQAVIEDGDVMCENCHQLIDWSE